MSELLIGQSLVFGEANMPTREGEIVERLEDIYNIPTPVVGMSIFVKDTKKSYIVKSLKKENIGGKEVYTKVDELVCIEEQIEALETENVGRDAEINSNKVKVNALTNSLNSEIARAQEAEAALNDLINGEGSNAKYSTRFIGVFSNLSDLLAGLDSLVYNDSQEDKNLGSFRALLAQRIVEIKNVSLVRGGSSLVQVVLGPFEESNGSLSLSSTEYGIFSRIHDNTWSKWKSVFVTIEDFEDEMAKLIDKAPDNLNTLKEIANWIEEHEDIAEGLIVGVQRNAEAITNEVTRAKAAEEELEVQIADEAARATAAERANAEAVIAEKERAEAALTNEINKLKNGDIIVGQAREIHSEDGRSLVDETRNFLDKMYANTGKDSSKDVADYITDIATNIPLATTENNGLMSKEDKSNFDLLSQNYFFSLYSLRIKDNTLTIPTEGFSFLFIQGSNQAAKYKYYQLQRGTFDIPTGANEALVVNTSNTDENNRLVIYVKSLSSVTNNEYVLGYTNSIGKFIINNNYGYAETLNNHNDAYILYGEKPTLKDNILHIGSSTMLLYRDNISSNFAYKAIVAGDYDLSSLADGQGYVVSLDNLNTDGQLLPYITTTIIAASSKKFPLIAKRGKSIVPFLLDYKDLNDEEALNERITEISVIASNAENSIMEKLGRVDGITVRTTSVATKLQRYYYLNAEDGKMVKEESGWTYRISDFIDISGLQKIVSADLCFYPKTNACGIAFYSAPDEDSFISSITRVDEEYVYGWVATKGEINIPIGAKYCRIAGNDFAYAPNSPYIEGVVAEVVDENKFAYADRPSAGYEYFTYDVDTSFDNVYDDVRSTSIIGSPVISEDNGMIRLPESYTPDGLPTRLVILNHGAAGEVTSSSAEDASSSFALLLQKKGYAVLYINGVPANMRNEKYLTKATHMGGYVYQRSALAAYKYVTEKYNLAKDGCFIIGRSMGGVTSLNLAMSGAIPVKALALDAPVIDAFHDAYFDGYWANGTLGGKTGAIFPWIQQWRYCDFTNDTYTIPVGEYKVFGSTYNVSVEEVKPLANLYNSTRDMAILWHLNSDIQCGYNAYKTGDFLVKNLDDAHVYNTSTDNDDEYYGKKLPCPCKIWFGSGDTVNQPSIAERFVRKCRNGGSIAVLRTVPTNDHAVWGVTTIDGASISIVEDGITCSPYGVELWQWIKRWDD